MPENRTSQLVDEARKALRRPYGEDVTDEVFEVIENDPNLREEYCAIARKFTGGSTSLNNNIGYFVKKNTRRKIHKSGNLCKRNKLAKKYSKLVVDTG